jgi:hypothetical protein
MTPSADNERSFSLVIVSLLRGVVYREEDPNIWTKLLAVEAQVRDYVRVMGLDLVIAEDEGFSWLASASPENEDEKLPPLVVKRQLSYPVSLLLALLRRRLSEHDASTGEARLIVSREEIVNMIRTFLPSGTNEARLVDQIEAHINKAIELGFVRRLKLENNKYEVRRIIKAFIDAQWLSDFNTRLDEYRKYAAGENAESEAQE